MSLFVLIRIGNEGKVLMRQFISYTMTEVRSIFGLVIIPHHCFLLAIGEIIKDMRKNLIVFNQIPSQLSSISFVPFILENKKSINQRRQETKTFIVFLTENKTTSL